MKNWVVLILLALSACVATYCYTVKFDKPTDVDRIRGAMTSMNKYFPLGARLVLKCDVPGADLFPEYVSYYLTPVKLIAPNPAGNDTTLLLTSLGSPNGTTDTMFKNSAVLCQYKDDKFQYVLIRRL